MRLNVNTIILWIIILTTSKDNCFDNLDLKCSVNRYEKELPMQKKKKEK